jgi:hypothetical protein
MPAASVSSILEPPAGNAEIAGEASVWSAPQAARHASGMDGPQQHAADPTRASAPGPHAADGAAAPHVITAATSSNAGARRLI